MKTEKMLKKNHLTTWCVALFNNFTVIVISWALVSSVVMAQSNGLSATAERLSDTANGSRASASGLSRGAAESSVGNINRMGSNAVGEAAQKDDSDTGRSDVRSPVSGPCGEAYRKDRKLGKNSGSRLGCGAE